MVGYTAFNKTSEAMVFFDGANIVAVNRDGGYIDHGVAGVDDDTVIQAAIDYVNSLGTGGTVAIGTGLFVIYSPLELAAYVNLIGQGMSTMIYAANGLDDNIVEITGGCHSNTISDMYIDGNSGSNTLGTAVYINVGAPVFSAIKLFNLFIYGAAEYGVYISSMSGYVNLRDSVILSCSTAPIYNDTTTTQVYNVYGYAPLKDQRGSISSILEIIGDARGLYPGVQCTGLSLTDFTSNSHDGVSSTELRNITDFCGKTYAYYLSPATPARNLTVPSDPDFTFGTGLSDSAFSIFSAFYRPAVVACTLMSKRDDTLLQYEWNAGIGAGAVSAITFTCYDQSVPAYINVVSSDVIWNTDWHTFVATYDGSSVETGLTIFLDGIDISLTHNINGAYVAMEPLAADVGLGCHHDNGVTTGHFLGDMTYFGITGKELNAQEAWSLDQRIRNVLGV